MVLESWIGVESWILPKGEAEGIQPSQGPPAAPRQDLECWSTKPLESFCPFDGEVPKLNLPQQIQAVLLIPVLHEEFQHSNEELELKSGSFPGKNLRDLMCTFPWISSTKHTWNI